MLRMSLYRCIAAAFLTLALAGPAAAQLLDRIVAVVNEDVILMSEFQDELAQVRSQLQQRDIEAPSEQELRQQVLERLVVEQLQIDAANRRGITVDQATLDAAVRRVAERNNLDLRGFRDALVNQGMSMDGFRERLRRQILVQRLRQRVMDQRVNVTPQEIEQYTARLAEDQQEYHLRHILVALPEAASPEAIADARDKAEALRRQLTEGGANFATLAAARSDGRNALEGGDLGWRRAGELPGVIADRLNALDPGGISEVLRTPSGFHLFKMEDRRAAERHVVTQSHIRHIMIQTNEVVTDSDARKRLQALRQRIEGGASFEALARASSDDKATAADGGDMGWLGPQEMPPAVRRAVEGMQAGSVSRPFKSRNGWHLIQLVEQRRKDTTEAYRRNQAAEQLRQRKEDEELELWLRQLREEAYVDYRLDNPAGAANS
ncbi:Chaperone SurA [wastewater metagenome]|uniref:Chaperone SurA n=2 Tax=unclassified sequences TaxID=12908 RepID=A0A5B8RFV6_9ZZZZ|nr:chaperone SurA [uncultured organism]